MYVFLDQYVEITHLHLVVLMLYSLKPALKVVGQIVFLTLDNDISAVAKIPLKVHLKKIYLPSFVCN